MRACITSEVRLQHREGRNVNRIHSDHLHPTCASGYRFTLAPANPRLHLYVVPSGALHLSDLYTESGQTLQGSFPAVSKPKFASKPRDLHNALLLHRSLISNCSLKIADFLLIFYKKNRTICHNVAEFLVNCDQIFTKVCRINQI